VGRCVSVQVSVGWWRLVSVEVGVCGWMSAWELKWVCGCEWMCGCVCGCV